MAERLLFNEPSVLSEAEEKELQTLASQTQRTPPLTPATAYLKAREVVAGELFAQAKDELTRLDKIDRQAERALNDYQERIERGLKIGRILPNNAINLRRLVLEHQKARFAYNDSARRFENRLEVLRTPENRTKIRNLAADMLAHDSKQRLTVSEAAERLAIAHRYASIESNAPKNVIEFSIPAKRSVKPTM